MIGTLPCVPVTGLNQDANMANNCRFRHAQVDGQSSKKSKKSGGKDQLPY